MVVQKGIVAVLLAAFGLLGIASTWGRISVKRDTTGTCVSAAYGVRVLDNEYQGSQADCRAV